MPSKYIEKQYAGNSFYHVFNRGVEKRNIFMDEYDFKYFIELFERYLGPEEQKDTKYRLLPNYSDSIELLAYCLMPNHFHLLLYQRDDRSMQQFMRSLSTSYSMYFNKKYKRVGSLIQDRYKAVRIDEDSYLTHISRYIHLNPLDINRGYLSYPYSSVRQWTGKLYDPSWLRPARVRSQIETPEEYIDFLACYEEVKEELDEIKQSLKE